MLGRGIQQEPPGIRTMTTAGTGERSRGCWRGAAGSERGSRRRRPVRAGHRERGDHRGGDDGPVHRRRKPVGRPTRRAQRSGGGNLGRRRGGGRAAARQKPGRRVPRQTVARLLRTTTDPAEPAAVRPGAGIDRGEPGGEAAIVRPIAAAPEAIARSWRRTAPRFRSRGLPTARPIRPDSAASTFSGRSSSGRWSRSSVARKLPAARSPPRRPTSGGSDARRSWSATDRGSSSTGCCSPISARCSNCCGKALPRP